jgi:intein-encoded DNA endonuclease-like protein
MPIYKTLNHNFFKSWSDNTAYVLGFFAADGSMTKNKRGAHFIEFHITDKEILEKIQLAIASSHKIAERSSGKSEHKTVYRLQIGSKAIFQDLLTLGMSPQKSLTLKFPNVPNQYLRHFVRGYFDGDGNVYFYEYQRKDRKSKVSRSLSTGFTCGSRAFLEKLQKKLQGLALLRGGSLYYHSGAYRLSYSTRDSCKLYNFMYNDGDTLLLERKKIVFEKFLQR